MRDPGPGDGHRDATIARGGRFALAHNPETLVGSERAFGLALRALDGVETPSLVMMTTRCPIPGRDTKYYQSNELSECSECAG